LNGKAGRNSCVLDSVFVGKETWMWRERYG